MVRLGAGVTFTFRHWRPQNLDIMTKSDVNEELERLRKALSAHKHCILAMMLRAENLEAAILSALNPQLQAVFENPEKHDAMLPL